MADLDSEQYQKVLLFMQSTNEEDFQRASQSLRDTAFDLQKAIQLRQSHRQSRNQLPQSRRQINQPSDEAIAIRYMNHLRSKNQQWSLFGSLFANCTAIFGGLFKFLAQILLPQSLVLKLLRSQFYQLYSNRIRLLYKQQELIKLLQKTKHKDKRSVLIAVSDRQTHQVFVDLFNKREIVAKVELHFHFAGYMLDDKALDLLVGEKFAPEILVCRMNIFDEVVIVGRFGGDQLLNLSPQTLTRCYKEGQNLCKRDQNVLIKYRNYISKVCGYNFVEEEEDQVDFVDLQRNTEEIRRQNQTYKQIEEGQKERFQVEEIQRQKTIKELRQLEQYQELRKIRKMSLPNQPVDGQIVRISFRCPDGTTIIRNFANSEKVELLFTWVELNQEIVFQDSRRCFQIMYSYPPQPLSHHKQRLLSQIFQQSHEKVLVRQL